ncbi:MAG: pullulanase-type alpha-1,6-glucosidase [Burkholderiales bacterium]|nr:pullulanase-type alpha-1,6-glucosidase [Burkholderiales bacterium]
MFFDRLLRLGSVACLLLGAIRAIAAGADCEGPASSTLVAGEAPIAAQAWGVDRHWIFWPGSAPADSRYWLVHARGGRIAALPGQPVSGSRLALDAGPPALPAEFEAAYRWLGPGRVLAWPQVGPARLKGLLRQQLVVVETDAAGLVRHASAIQAAGTIDDLYAAASALDDLGVRVGAGATRFKLWAPTAQAVSLCLYPAATGPALAPLPLRRDERSGAWSVALAGDRSGDYYSYLVDVHVRGVGLVRNRVTDPYSLSLTTDSHRSWIGRLDAPDLYPPGWAATTRPPAAAAATDAVIYELHLRDFSATDASVPAAHRGKYLAFTDADSLGMRHLRALAAAGVTDIHLLPLFDFASVPEQGCVTPDAQALARAAPDSAEQQARVLATAATDCYNWGYDPWHYGAPEGSYATDAGDGAVRIREFRAMVQALHRAGLRVGMDLVYNHTVAAGQDPRSVLDRIVPGYYQRLDAQGQVETSTCCANTATEHAMMAKLMIDTAVRWARDYAVDGFRFDLMGHQPRAAMERLQAAVDGAAGRHIPLIGEGWNFGEVADGRRFVQAAQGRLAGTGIATFSDRGRDAVRGGGCCDDAAATLARQGWINGLHYAPNGHGPAADAAALNRAADLVRVGLAGTLADYRLTTADGSDKTLAEIDYAGHGAGYASQPDEVVNYVENHDNPTLWDIAELKLPRATSMDDRARVQVLGLAVTALSQGIAYFHAGVELLASKSGDRNSFDSGDWFNRLDWSATDNHWGSGLPPKPDNGALWPALAPLLADPALKPGPAQIRFARDAYFDLLRIRTGTTLLRLRSAGEIRQRLNFYNLGPDQQGSVIVGHLDGRDLPGAVWSELLYAINAGTSAATLKLPDLEGHALRLHPVQAAPTAADKRPAASSRWDAASATLTVPPRTVVVYVGE